MLNYVTIKIIVMEERKEKPEEEEAKVGSGEVRPGTQVVARIKDPEHQAEFINVVHIHAY